MKTYSDFISFASDIISKTHLKDAPMLSIANAQCEITIALFGAYQQGLEDAPKAKESIEDRIKRKKSRQKQEEDNLSSYCQANLETLGEEPSQPKEKCALCGGRGEIHLGNFDLNEKPIYEECVQCNGRGTK